MQPGLFGVVAWFGLPSLSTRWRQRDVCLEVSLAHPAKAREEALTLQLATASTAVLRLAQRLVAPADLGLRWAANFEQEPEVGVRRKLLPLQVAAARALGAGLSLDEATRFLQQALFRDRGELAQAARQAIAEIQARLTSAERGQLSLAGGEAGALSLVTAAEPGRLSLTEAPAAKTRSGEG